jgi:hypothetical protein
MAGGALNGRELAVLLQATAGVSPLLVLADEDSGQALVAAPSADGTQVVLGMVDRDGDNAAVALERDAVAGLRDALTGWLED